MSTHTTRDAIPRITHARATAVGLAALDQMIDLLGRLEQDHWSARTDCAAWDVADMVGHVIGAMRGHVSMRESVRQFVHGLRHAGAHGGNSLDAMNALQVAEHVDLDPAERLAVLAELGPRAVRRRTTRNRVLRAMPVPLDGGKGSMMGGLPATVSMGHLLDVVYTRDIWLHTVDIERATGVTADRSGDIDARIIHDGVGEWMGRHGQPVRLHLTGPAGGTFCQGDGGPELTLDAIEWARTVSGREQGEGLLAHPLLF